MTLTRNKLYLILVIASIAGYFWLFSFNGSETVESTGVCLIKHVTKIPCPSCGSTRSVISLTQGNFTEALLTNPLGYVVAVIMLLLPVWLGFDFITKRKSLFDFYKKLEVFFKTPKYAIPVIMLLLINWIWNITKAL